MPPGKDQSTVALELLALRLQVVEEGYKEGVTGSTLDCVSTGSIDRVDLADLDHDADADATSQKIQDAITQAVTACH